VPRVLLLGAFREEAFAAALAPARERRASAFRAHARAKTVLAFSGSLRWLKGAFHEFAVTRLARKERYTKNVVEFVNATAPTTALRRERLCGISFRAMSDNVVIEPATLHDLDELSGLLGELFSEESDFRPNKDKQLRGLRLLFEQPNRGRVFVLRRDNVIVGMINLLFTISTAEGGFVIVLEDLVIHRAFRGHGYGSKLLSYAIDFAKQKNFLRITLLTDRPEIHSQELFRRFGFYESSMIPMRLLISPNSATEVTL
jgi:GNAT superfamily N-acetyltransferase